MKRKERTYFLTPKGKGINLKAERAKTDAEYVAVVEVLKRHPKGLGYKRLWAGTRKEEPFLLSSPLDSGQAMLNGFIKEAVLKGWVVSHPPHPAEARARKRESELRTIQELKQRRMIERGRNKQTRLTGKAPRITPKTPKLRR